MQCDSTFIQLRIQYLLFLLVEMELLLEVGIKFVPIVVVSWSFEVHLLDLLFFGIDALLQCLYFSCDFADKIAHDEVLLIEGEEDCQEVSVVSCVRIPYFFLNAVEAPPDLCLLLKALLVLLVDAEVLLFLQLNIGLVLLHLPLQSVQLFSLHLFGFDELLKAEVMLYLPI